MANRLDYRAKAEGVELPRSTFEDDTDSDHEDDGQIHEKPYDLLDSDELFSGTAKSTTAAETIFSG